MLRSASILAAALVFLAAGNIRAEVTMPWVTVDNEGNVADTTGYGAVDYTYLIGKHEVTAGQYTEFLNAVAGTDTYELYNAHMADTASWWGCDIQRSGSAGSYSYSVSAAYANRPVNFVNFGDAARFVNWLANDQPPGVQDSSTTEDGSYLLNGATGAVLPTVARKPGARYVIPTEDEWYKAAYHKNDGATANYWTYPTQSDSPPSSEPPSGTDMVNGSANYYNGTHVDLMHGTTRVGAYTAKPSTSAYGTFDQSANVWEWNEAIIDPSWARGFRGGSFNYTGSYMQASVRHDNRPHGHEAPFEAADIGFRVALSPTPPSQPRERQPEPDPVRPILRLAKLSSSGTWEQVTPGEIASGNVHVITHGWGPDQLTWVTEAKSEGSDDYYKVWKAAAKGSDFFDDLVVGQFEMFSNSTISSRDQT